MYSYYRRGRFGKTWQTQGIIIIRARAQARKDHCDSSGIIVCKSKNKTTVEYAIRDSNKPIGVSYLENELPTPEQVSKLLEVL